MRSLSVRIGAAVMLAGLFLVGFQTMVDWNTQIRNKPFVSVKDFKALGNGTTDDTAALQSAFAYAVANGVGLYFPKGTYITSQPLTTTGNHPMRLRGDTRDNSVVWCSGCPAGSDAAIQLGDNTANPHIEVEDMSIWGNANTTYALDVQGSLNLYMKSVAVGPAATYCLRLMNWVGGVLDNVAADGNHTGGWPGNVMPTGGVIFTGASGASHGNMLTVNGFVGQNINGIAMDFAQTDSIVVNNPQLTNNVANIQIEATASNIAFIGGLSEQFSTRAGSVNLYGIKNIFLNTVWANTNLHVYAGANNNIFKSCFFQGTITVDTGAIDTDFESNEASFFNTTFAINDPTTKMSDWHDYTAQQPSSNLPLYLRRVTPSNSLGINQQPYSPTIVSGSFIALKTTTPVTIVSTAFPTISVAWRAWFRGNWEVGSLPQSLSLPTAIEVSDDQPTVALDGTNSLTFGINATTGVFQMTANNALSNIAFTGTIYLQIEGSAAGSYNADSLWLTHALKAPQLHGTTSIDTPLMLLDAATRPTCNNTTNGGAFSYNTSAGEPIQVCEGTSQSPTAGVVWRSPLTYVTGAMTITVGSGAGTGATAVLDANARMDGGLITLVTGTSPSTNTILFTLNFPANQNRSTYCTYFPANGPAAAGMANFVAQNEGNGLSATMFSSTAAPAASTQFQFAYTCH